MNLANTIYLAKIRAWKDPKWHRIETMNELFVALVCYYSVLFTDFVRTPEQQYDFGWQAIGLTLLFIIINILLLIWAQAREVRLFYLKYYNRL